MNTLKKIATAVLLIVIPELYGCANYIKIGEHFARSLSEYVNPNRPLPPQPQVPAEVKSALAKKPLHQIPVFLGDVVYYNEIPLIHKINKKETEINFTKDAKKINNPTTEVVVSAHGFLKTLGEYLQNSGFKVVDQSCGTCLRLDVDFSTFTLNVNSLRPVTVIFARTRVFYGEIEILETRDDRPGSARKAFIGSDEAPIVIAKHATAMIVTEELTQAWTIAIKGEKAIETQKSIFWPI